MEPNVRRTKKMAKKSALNTRKTAVQAEKKIPAVPASYSTSWRDEEELVDYEPRGSTVLFPSCRRFSEPEDRLRTPVPEEADDSDPDDGFCEIPAEDTVMAGRKRRRIFQQLTNKDDVDKDELAAPPRKGGKSIISAEADDSVATLPGIISGGSKSAFDKDELAAPPRRGGKPIISAKADDSEATLPGIISGGSKSAFDKDELATPPRMGGKPIISAKADDSMATLPVNTWEGNKPVDPDKGRFVAVRGTGSNAPGFTDEHDPRPSKPSVDEVSVGNNFPYKESISQEYQASDEVDKAPQQRSGPLLFETPRISKSGGL
jgi:hypothetical protein